MDKSKNEIVLFENQGIKLEVNVNQNTVWLTQSQMEELFDVSHATLNEHISNIYEEGELDKDSTCRNFRQVQIEGDRTVKRNIAHYNLDVIISVGYRVKSKNGVIFRKWATKVLNSYLIEGYAINKRRLEYLEKTVQLIDIANRVGDETDDNGIKTILKVIGEYSKALDLLDMYDNGTLEKVDGKRLDERKIDYASCVEIVNGLKFNEKSTLFANEKDNGLESIINDIYQSFNGEDVYKSIEEKGANFLYLIVKNHVYTDGNKRIAATLFVYFLNFYGILYNNENQVIDKNTLVALTLLIAESKPEEKETMIDLVMNFLNNN